MEEDPNSEVSTSELIKPEFKKPVLIGKVGKLPKKVAKEPEKSIQQSTEGNDNKPTLKIDKPKHNLPPAVLLKELSTPIPYKEPKWSGLCPDGSDYALEVLKSGMIVERIDLTTQPYYVFGRLANSDVIMAHPTISRHHAVLQYKAFAEEGEQPAGWYIFDLGSTHGTFLNKDKLKPNHYTRVRVGHQIKFGSSTRTHIVTGPDFDCEGESDLTVTEIKARANEMRKDRDKMIQEAKERREIERLEEERKREEQGIDWGMGEDAEEEPDLSENPYATTANEELYLDDPKKTLRGYFEREGHELTYDCEERGVGQFICRVELPLDDARGKPVVAEVIHKGKKKEAVVACALEACRVLDRAGLLRQAKHESRRRKERDWGADDYYDSDEDCFLDRTGSVEKKRNARMRKYGQDSAKTAAETPLTYDTLLKKVAEIELKISVEEKSLQRLREVGRTSRENETGDDGDSLDNYMQNLGKQGHSMAQKAEISSTKMAIKKLQAELAKTQRLAEIARPAHLLPLLKKDQSKLSVKVAGNSVVYGKRIRLKDEYDKKPKPKQPQKQSESEFVEEMDSDDEDIEESREPETKHSERLVDSETKEPPETDGNESETGEKPSETNHKESEAISKKSETISKKSETISKHSETDKVSSETSQKKQYGPMRPPENYVIPESYFDQTSDRDLPEIMDENE